MQKKFVKHSIVYTLATLFNRGIAFLLLPLMTRYLHPGDYGTIDFILITSTFVIMLCGLEMHQGLSRFISEQPTQQDKNSLFSSIIVYLLASYLIFTILANLFKSVIIEYLVPINNMLLFNLVWFIFLCQGLIYYFSVMLRFNLRPIHNMYLNAMTGLSILLFNVFFVIYLHLGLFGAVYALACGNFCGIILGLIFCREYMTLDINLMKIKQMVSFSYPLVLSSLSVAIMLYADRIMLKELLSLNEVGIFGVGYRFASIISIVMVGVQSSIGPLIYNSMNNPSFKEELANLFNRFFTLGICTLVIICLLSKWIIYIMVPFQYHNAIITLCNMSIAIFFSQLYVFMPGLQINKKTKKILCLNLFGGVLNIILCYYFIKLFGLNGASLASMLSYIIFFLVYLAVSQKELLIPFKYNKMIMLFIMLVIGYLINIKYIINIY